MYHYYVNTPRASAPATMHTHEGTAILHLSEPIRLEGHYYTGRDRVTQGELRLQKSD